MRRTYCAAATRSFAFLRAGVKAAMRAALDAARAERCDVVLLAGLSTGLYAGRWRERINDEFEQIVKELLAEPVAANGSSRAHCFRRVVWTKLLPDGDGECARGSSSRPAAARCCWLLLADVERHSSC